MYHAQLPVATEEQEEAIAAVLEEREYQDDRWGTADTHDVGGFLTLIRVALRHAEDAFAKDSERSLDYVRKIAALAVACMEENGVVTRQQFSTPIADLSKATLLPTSDAITQVINNLAKANPFFK